MESQTLLAAILGKMPDISKWQRHFILHLIPLFLSIKGRINFMQMSRYGQYIESTYRNNFSKPFDFGQMNHIHITENGSGYYTIIFDPSHMHKSGKHTYGKSIYWSGCDNASKPGLEIGGIAIGDIANHTAFHYEAIQTPSMSELKKNGKNLLDHYASLIIARKDELIKFSKHLVVDAYFSKQKYVDSILTSTDFHLISRLRDDVVLKYIYQGEPTGKRGRPQLYDGKIDITRPDMNHFQKVYQDNEYIILSAVVHAKALKRNIKLALVQYLNQDGTVKNTKIYFSTDLEISAWFLYKYYQNRFQIEFIYRDANQFVGLEQCQARSEEKLNFHFNASLSAVSIAKSAHWLSIPKEERKSFSMTDVKTLYHNRLLINRFFDVLGIDPNTHINNTKLKELYYFGSLAA